jgi:hypothetical protein
MSLMFLCRKDQTFLDVFDVPRSSYIDYVTIVGMMIPLNAYHYYDAYHKCRSVDKYQMMSHKNVEIVDTPV